MSGPFKMKSGNTTPFKQMGSSPVKKNIFKGREGYDPAAKRAKFKADITAFGQGLKKAGKDIKGKVDKAAMYMSSDAIRARRKTSLANKNKIGKEEAINTYNAKEKIRTDLETKSFRANQAAKTVEYRKNLATKTKKLNKPGLLERQITKTAQKKKSTSKPTVKQEGLLSREIRKTAKAKTERLTGPKQAKKFKKINNIKLTTTGLTGTTISGKKVNKNKMAVNNKPTGSNTVKAKKTKAKKTKATKPVDLTRKTGLGPRE